MNISDETNSVSSETGQSWTHIFSDIFTKKKQHTEIEDQFFK